MVKGWIAKRVEEVMSGTIGSEVRVSSVSVNLFNSVTADELVVYDKLGKRMINVDRVDLSFDCLALFEGKLRILNLKLLKGSLCVYKQSSDSEYNFQFVVDSLSPKGDSKKGLELEIGSVVLKDLDLSYDVVESPHVKQLVDVNHFVVKKIDCSLICNSLKENDLNLRLRNLSFKLSDSLGVDQLRSKIRLKNNSKLNADVLMGTLLFGDVSTFIHNSHVCLNIKGNSLVSILSDLRLCADVDISKKKKFGIVASLSNRGLRFDNNLQMSFSASVDGRKCLDVNTLSSFPSLSYVDADYNINLRREDVMPILYMLKVKFPNQILLDNFDKVLAEGSFSYNHGNLKSKGVIESNIGTISHNIDGTDRRVGFSLNFKDVDLPINNNKKVRFADASLDGFLGSDGVCLKKMFERFDFDLIRKLSFKTNFVVNKLDACGMVVDRAFSTVNYNNNNADVSLDVDGKDISLYCKSNMQLPELLTMVFNKTRSIGNHRNPSNKIVSLNARVDKLDINALGNLVRIPDFKSLNADDVDFQYWASDDFKFALKGCSFVYKKEKACHVNEAVLSRHVQNGVSLFELTGDSCVANLYTNMSFGDMENVCKMQLANHFPSLFNKKTLKYVGGADDCFADFKLSVLPGSFIERLFCDRLKLNSLFSAEGHVSLANNMSVLTAIAPCVSYDDMEYKNVSLYYNNKSDSLVGAVMLTRPFGDSAVRLEASLIGRSDLLNSQLRWQDIDDPKNSGTIQTRSLFSLGNSNSLCCDINVLPSEVYVRDTLWKVSPSNILYCDGKWIVNKFSVSRLNQFLKINANLSDQLNDFLLELNDVEISYLLSLVDFKPVEFSGRASGIVRNMPDFNQLMANLKVNNFKFNTGPMGVLSLDSRVDLDSMRICFDAKAQRTTDDSTMIDGSVDIRKNYLDLNIKSEKITLQFLNKYVRNFISDLDGTVSGRFHLFGNLSYLNMEGQHLINYMKFRPKMLNVLYSIGGDSLHLRPDTIDFGGIVLRDSYGNTSTISGSLNHHSLFDFDYKIDFGLNNLMVIDWEKEASKSFWGHVSANGNVSIAGDFDKVNIDGELSTSGGSEDCSVLYYNSETSALSEDEKSYIHFVSPQNADGSEVQNNTNVVLRDDGTDIFMNLKLNVNPNSTLNIITDPITNDYMSLVGSGPLSLSYYNKGRFLLNGQYGIKGGIYKLTIKDVIRRNFVIQPDGYLRFNGSLSDGDIYIKGVHKINSVSLSDLNIGASHSNSTIGADCILNFTGKTSEPKVSFDLDFPNANTDENKIIKNILLTEEDRNLQAVYLLSIGRFYTYNYNSFDNSGQSQSSVAMTSFLAGTLSGQINTLLQDAFRVTNWNFDTNIAAGRRGLDDMEVQGALSGKMFNNRLLFNGNIGYRDQITTYSNNFVGNFNLQWFLNNSGSISLKAYSETNDRYFTKSSLTTQGGGILFRRDFDRLHFFFRKRK